MKWYLKSTLQKVLSIVPGGVLFNNFMQEHCGELKNVDIEKGIVEVKELFIKPIIERYGTISNLSIAEIGTGWIPILPIVLDLLGNKCTSYDIVDHIKNNRITDIVDTFMSHLEYFTDIQGFNLETTQKKLFLLKSLQSGEKPKWLISPVDTTYLPLSDNSQDVVVSRLVLQHIPQEILPDVVQETWRILRTGGIAIHKINLHDEYAQVDPQVTLINFLKFSVPFWNFFINNRIKFVNQARYPYYLELFQKTGFRIRGIKKKLDENSYNALSSMRIADEFKHHSKEELATISITVTLEKCNMNLEVKIY